MTESNSVTPSDVTPKVFLSYSWSSTEYIDRIEELARSLVRDGVQVVFDQWDLSEGQDVHAYMEQAVTDPTVTRVLLLCDPIYAEKADGRRGGVGKETLIISTEVYEHASQTKFIPVVMERDANGSARLPAYLNGRFRIDLSDSLTEGEQYERLLRNLFSRPERQRPELGKRPAFLDETVPMLQTGRALQTFKDAVQRERAHAPGLLTDYLDRLVQAFTDERIADPSRTSELLCVQQIESIGHFRPYRDEFVDLILFLGRYGERLDFYHHLHDFFESILTIRWEQRSTYYRDGLETENLAFLCWELWLYAIGGLLRAGRGEAVSRLFEPYYVPRSNGEKSLASFALIDDRFEMLQEHNPERQAGRRYQSYAAKLLRERAADASVPFEALMEADVLGWFRSAIEPHLLSYWYPRTLVYRRLAEALPTFVRAESPTVFGRLAPAFGVRDRVEMEQLYETISSDRLHRIGDFPGGKHYARLLSLSSARSG